MFCYGVDEIGVIVEIFVDEVVGVGCGGMCDGVVIG